MLRLIGYSSGKKGIVGILKPVEAVQCRAFIDENGVEIRNYRPTSFTSLAKLELRGEIG
jgi:hypothetical protein